MRDKSRKILIEMLEIRASAVGSNEMLSNMIDIYCYHTGADREQTITKLRYLWNGTMKIYYDRQNMLDTEKYKEWSRGLEMML